MVPPLDQNDVVDFETATVQAPPRGKRPVDELPAKREERPAEKDHPKKQRFVLLRRHPVASGIGLAALLAATAAGGLYWDHARHFETTDDAFIAARQFAVAPKVAGYITAVPVTDNQHVATGNVIARIDQRDYRVALALAEAQVAAGEAGIENIDAQIDVQRAQIAANQAQVAQARPSWCSRRSRRRAMAR